MSTTGENAESVERVIPACAVSFFSDRTEAFGFLNAFTKASKREQSGHAWAVDLVFTNKRILFFPSGKAPSPGEIDAKLKAVLLLGPGLLGASAHALMEDREKKAAESISAKYADAVSLANEIGSDVAFF